MSQWTATSWRQSYEKISKFSLKIKRNLFTFDKGFSNDVQIHFAQLNHWNDPWPCHLSNWVGLLSWIIKPYKCLRILALSEKWHLNWKGFEVLPDARNNSEDFERFLRHSLVKRGLRTLTHFFLFKDVKKKNTTHILSVLIDKQWNSWATRVTSSPPSTKTTTNQLTVTNSHLWQL